MSDKNWFEVDRKGLAKLVERRGGGNALLALMYELISNAWDADGTSTVTVTLAPEEGVPKVWISVTDDAPDGFQNLAHSWTLFAESSRKGDAEKRGRFNLGEKLVLAFCEEASITTTTGSVTFDHRGRTNGRIKRNHGSEFVGLVRATRAELVEVRAGLMKIIPPDGITTLIEGTKIFKRELIKTITGITLPTEVADDEGVLRRTRRKCGIDVYHAIEGETAMLFEMGIPVVETGDKWHVDVNQKVPLNMDRDNVTPGFLREVRACLVNAMFDQLSKDDANATFVNEAMADADAAPEAINAVLDLKYGVKRAIFDPSDVEANMNLVAQGYTLMHGSQLTKDQWANVRRAGAAQPAGQIAPTKMALFGPGGKDTWVPEEKWTPAIRRVVKMTRELCEALTDKLIDVGVLSDITESFGACFTGRADSLSHRQLTFNLGRLGHAWFDGCIENGRLFDIVIHELGHYYEPNHLDKKYHDALTSLGARMVQLALSKPEMFR